MDATLPTAHDRPVPDSSRPLLIVTGLSGAGKSTALKALEDLDYEAVDNLPIGLIDALLDYERARPLALGIDSRTRDFDAETLVAKVQNLRAGGADVRLLYLDCDDDELVRRFSETRRRHPLAGDRPAMAGVAAERALTLPLKLAADIAIDTSDLGTTELRRRIAERLGGGDGLTITLQSFGFAQGLPRHADLVFDMRFLANPHWDPDLRPLTGEDAAVADYVADDPLYGPALDQIAGLLGTLLPGYAREGKAYLTIAIGCTGGRHRSVAVVRDLADRLNRAGHRPVVVHRDMNLAGSPLTSHPA